MANINYADADGYSSLAAAIVFIVPYVPLCGLFILQCFRNLTYVRFVLILFCQIRIAAFTIRAILIASDSAGENLSLFIADQVLFGIGFFGLLYAAYSLVLDRELLSDEPPAKNIISRLGRNRMLFHLSLSTGVALGVAGTTIESNDPTSSTGTTLRKASIAIFLVLTVLQACLTIALIMKENDDEYHTIHTKSFGEKHGSFILCAISFLLLVREIFLMATIDNTKTAANEHFWYPLVALPEVLAVTLYCAPGLAPERFELPK
ncbi:uncharacterized protein BT62DRAFT_53761 [Guyanagaster necrorhizus]|uniref:DUF7702 domain-containing protein n=1 Tax=Guyanagaster necrorhizus TaxID=856835 RepID=A0A9P8AZG2_9AGAR|nr:uncharacterized protein BT62DRAFT_53761 [Guyanagaster necrorhizus MCA 3950]KAG7453246.1 hypothetical protein BT62DRAFT_53761 [Guyanagaster necrorhizus MCA 3950]